MTKTESPETNAQIEIQTEYVRHY